MNNVIDASPVISIITQIEIQSWKTDKKVEVKILDFIDECSVVNIEPGVLKLCIELRRKKKIKPYIR